MVRRLAALLAFAATASAQTSTPAATKPLTYELVSIHPHDPNDESWTVNTTEDGLVAKGTTLNDLFGQAYGYGFGPIADSQISGAPGWFKSQRFDIVAKVDVDDIPAYKKADDIPLAELLADMASHTPTPTMLMMRQLLAERFQLKVHEAKKEVPVYALTLAKGGSKLAKAANPKDGNINTARGEMTAAGVPIVFLISILSPMLSRPILDQTGLTETYDFKLKWTPDTDAGADAGKLDAPPGIFTAIQEQLGLKLDATKGAVDAFVIDHVEKPDGN